MARAPSISSGAVRKLLDTAPRMGVDVTRVCTAVGFDRAACGDKDARVPVVVLHALWEAVLEQAPRADAALFIATHYEPGDYGLVGFVCMNSRTVGEALQHVVRFSRLWTDSPAMLLDDDGTLSLSYPLPLPDRRGLHMANEAAMAELLHSARTLTEDTFVPERVEFMHAAPADLRAHRAFFRCPVEFRQPATRIHFGRAAAALPLPRADAQLGEFLRSLANDALAKHAKPDSVPDQLRGLVAEALHKGMPELRDLAPKLAMSERTLRRRLEEEGTSFRELLDATRGELARTWVKNADLPLSEVAFMLGFSEPSAFHRAFKRWTGVTPASFRAA